ncbi:MAG TPA: response regulator [Sediminispirochaeta sp.]|nr:response regulator [Sediminispirochaeta sp.]
MAKRILAIDDEESVLYVLEELLKDMGYEVDSTVDPEEGVKMAIDRDYDLYIVDLRMPNKDGAQVTREILEKKPDALILINTGFAGDPLAAEALKAGAKTLIKKPLEIEKIYDFLR